MHDHDSRAPLSATIDFVRRERKLGRAGTSFWIDMGIVARAILYALAAHLTEIALWAENSATLEPPIITRLSTTRP